MLGLTFRSASTRNSQVPLQHSNSHDADARHVDGGPISDVRLEILLASDIDANAAVLEVLGRHLVRLDGHRGNDDVGDGEALGQRERARRRDVVGVVSRSRGGRAGRFSRRGLLSSLLRRAF